MEFSADVVFLDDWAIAVSAPGVWQLPCTCLRTLFTHVHSCLRVVQRRCASRPGQGVCV